MAPSSFASAAAGSNPNQRDAPSDWSRRTNGATQTFRRTSNTTSMNNAAPHDGPSLANPQPRYVPPHRNGPIGDTRYSKDQLLDLYKAQQSVEGGLNDGLQNLYVGGWQPDMANGAGTAPWGRADHSRDTQPGPDLCWDRDGNADPLSLHNLDEEERDIFAGSVNTPLKPPTTATKDTQQSNGVSGRKFSVSNQATTPTSYAPMSPTANRGTGRRRDASESYPFPTNPLASPTGGFNRDDQRTASPPPSLLRRRTDLKDPSKAAESEGDDRASSNPFGSLKRNQTNPLSAGFAAPASPWNQPGPQSAGMSPMGSFGNFGLGAPQGTPTEKRGGLGGGRAESRFKNLLSKDSGEDLGSSVERKTSMASLPRVNENESWRPQHGQNLGGAPPDEKEEEMPTGSAALAADADISPPHARQGGFRGYGTPSRGESRDDYGLGQLGMTADNAHAFGQGFFPGRDAFQQTPAQQRSMGVHDPTSPTDTNPYKSPEHAGRDRMGEEVDPAQSEIPGLGGYGQDHGQQFGSLGGLGALPNLGRIAGGQGSAGDRSQTSSVGPNRGFAGLGGMGQFGGPSGSAAWPGHGGAGTPGRQSTGLSNPFGSGLFGNLGETQSPSLAGLGGGGMFSPQAGGPPGGSRMSSMFPTAMQDQMRQAEQDRDVGSDTPGLQPFPGLGDYGRTGGDHTFGQAELGDQQKPGDHQSAGPFGAPGQQSHQLAAQTPGQTQQPGSSASNQPPPPQQRTMVMPDRMRWIYRDPQGQTQGPWSGLEMHDWYKAGFFSPELLVKKYEDPDYEPLAQLIRRIGNSREPFLVPQIGIPHGPPSSQGPSAWAGPSSAGSSTAPQGTAAGAGGAQPPFASSFPSFGTTLTADQQNALERRKQEEQYLMARQKEHLAQAQIAQRMQLHPGQAPQSGVAPGSSQLNHHGSAQSLHSQPSFGSITSPGAGAYQQSPIQAPQGQNPGFFDNSFRAPGQGAGLGAVGSGVDGLGNIREEEIPGIMDRLNRGGAGQFGAPGQPFAGQQRSSSPPGQDQQQQQHQKQVQQMMRDRTALQQEQAAYDAKQQQADEQPASNERLQDFQQLQGQAPTGIDARFQPALHKNEQATAKESQQPATESRAEASAPAQKQPQQELSLTEQVQKAASAKQSPAPQHPGLPQPFPPGPSQSPLPAPAAQRAGRQSVADQLQTEQRDRSQTPSVDTPSAPAPWAKEPTEASKGPSLKQIQEMEAKKAAEAEEVASAARRAALQREMEAQANVTAPAPGLPASASWAASGGSPATPTGGAASPWAKAAPKPAGPATAKSMAQIQKEEEARKNRAAAVANAQAQASAATATPQPSASKSYANLAGKVSAPAAGVAQGAMNSAWTTVGAGGKTKTPLAPPTPVARTASAGVPQAAPTVKKPAVKPPTLPSVGLNAQDEFRKWAVGELRPDLNKGISADDFVSSLVYLPADIDILTEAVHGASSTLDSRHFAEEFIRRKRLADKGVVDTVKSASPAGGKGESGAGGWSEVAKKGPVGARGSEEVGGAQAQAQAAGANGSFRVVAGRKKGGKK